MFDSLLEKKTLSSVHRSIAFFYKMFTAMQASVLLKGTVWYQFLSFQNCYSTVTAVEKKTPLLICDIYVLFICKSIIKQINRLCDLSYLCLAWIVQYLN